MAADEVAVTGDPASPMPDDVRAGPSPSGRLALGVFLAYLVVAFVVILRARPWMWFIADDWAMLSGRELGTLDGHFRPYNGHLTAFPVLVFGLLYEVVGLRSYVPYQAATALLHLTLAGLLRVVMRRAGVGPWVATVTAGSFVLLGAGWENLVWAMQVSLVGSMVFGVTQLILTDHPGRFDRRDGVALAAGFLSVMSSSVGIVTVAIVGLAVLLRRGWRPAAAQTVPIAVAYGAWRWWWPTDPGGINPPATLAGVVDWLVDAVPGYAVGLVQQPIAAVVLGAVTVVGLALAWGPLSWTERRRWASVPLAMLVGCLAFTTVVAFERAGLAERLNTDLARSSRYVHIGVALLLPALAVALDAFVRRWRWAIVPAVALLLVGVPGNLRALGAEDDLFTEQLYTSERELVLGAAASPLLAEIPEGARLNPNQFTTNTVDAGFLRRAHESGRVPAPAGLKPADAQVVAVRLSMGQDPLEVPPPDHTCTTSSEPVEISPAKGDEFVIEQPVNIQVRTEQGGWSWPAGFTPSFASPTLRVQVEGESFRITPATPGTAASWCTVP